VRFEGCHLTRHYTMTNRGAFAAGARADVPEREYAQRDGKTLSKSYTP
jgi:N-formylglutamate amidohydrolase